MAVLFTRCHGLPPSWRSDDPGPSQHVAQDPTGPTRLAQIPDPEPQPRQAGPAWQGEHAPDQRSALSASLDGLPRRRKPWCCERLKSSRIAVSAFQVSKDSLNKGVNYRNSQHAFALNLLAGRTLLGSRIASPMKVPHFASTCVPAAPRPLQPDRTFCDSSPLSEGHRISSSRAALASPRPTAPGVASGLPSPSDVARTLTVGFSPGVHC